MSARPMFRVSRSYGEQAQDREWLSFKNRNWVLIALAVGFFVRVYQLTAQSLWNDEGTSAALAGTSIPAIINAAAHDIHPPLYYLLLHVWVQVGGFGEFSLRFLSVIAGVLVIAVTFRVAREFFDQDVAVIAAVLAALNPFQVYYAQETRMYICVTLFSALSVWMMVVMFKPPSENPKIRANQIRTRSLAFVCYILFTLAALYSNYYAFTVVVLENLSFLAWLIWAKRTKRPGIVHSLVFWVIAQVVIISAYIPWLLFARVSITSWPSISDAMSLQDMTRGILSAFVTGTDQLHDWLGLLVIIYTVVFIGGLFPSRDLFKQSAWGIVTCALWAIVPLLAMAAVSLSRPAYNPKFLLLATPGFLIVVARGVSVLYPGLFLRERAAYGGGNAAHPILRQVIGTGKLIVGFFFAAGAILALQSMYTDPQLQRDDYRGVINYINSVATDKDAVIVNAPGQLDVVRYYYHGEAELEGLPIGRPMNQVATQELLDKLLQSKENVFGIFWATDQADPTNFVENYLNENTFKAADSWHGNVRLTEYATEQTIPSANAQQVNAKFGDELTLSKVVLNDSLQRTRHIVPLELTWQANEPPQTDYKIFLHLLDSQNQIISQYDAPLIDGATPTTRWQPNHDIITRVGVVIPPGMPPGNYELYLGLYNGETGARLLIQNPDATHPPLDRLDVGAVHVAAQATDPQALFMTQRVNGNLGAIELLGYNLYKVNFGRGEFIPIVLYWQPHEKPSNDVAIDLKLVDDGNNVVATNHVSAAFPPPQWEPEEIVRDVQTLIIPSNALPGEYRIVASAGTQQLDVMKVQVK